MLAIFVISLVLIILNWAFEMILLGVTINENGCAEGRHLAALLIILAKTIALIVFVSILYAY